MNSGRFKNALVVKPGSIGDTVAAFPVFYSLKENSYNVYFIGSEKMIGYLERIKFIEKGIGFGDSRLLEFFTYQRKFTVPEMPDFDIVISYIEPDTIFGQNILNTYKDNAVFHPVPEEPASHITEFLLEPLHKSGIKVMFDIERKVNKHGNDILFIHPGSGSKKKNLPPEGFLEIFTELNQTCECRIIIGECEKSDMDYWVKNAGAENIIEPETIDELAKKLENGSWFIGNDSGVSHLAAFLGLDTFIIFGPTDPQIWAPKGKKVKIIQTTAECAPCNYQTRKNCQSMKCLKEINVQSIISMIKQVVKKKRR